MYTEGIRKIFTATGGGTDMNEAADTVRKAGYKAFSFNGDIYCKAPDGEWFIKTCFHITDFQDVQT
jgi:hypothetical protein